MFTTSGTYLFSFVTQIFHNGQPSHGVEYVPYVPEQNIILEEKNVDIYFLNNHQLVWLVK